MNTCDGDYSRTDIKPAKNDWKIVICGCFFLFVHSYLLWLGTYTTTTVYWTKAESSCELNTDTYIDLPYTNRSYVAYSGYDIMEILDHMRMSSQEISRMRLTLKAIKWDNSRPFNKKQIKLIYTYYNMASNHLLLLLLLLL